MSHIVVVGCGVVGAAIAYELSQNPALSITVLDKQPPAQASTGAALGVLMGAISQKKKGRAWAMRDASIRRYESLIPELEAKTGMTIPCNRDGIVLLRFAGEDDEVKWQELIRLRQNQGWSLHLWDEVTLRSHCPHVGTHLGDRPIIGAIYSEQDRQVDPTALTYALVEAAKQNGVAFQFGATVQEIHPEGNSPQESRRQHSQSSYYIVCDPPACTLVADWIVLSTGLGTLPLTQSIETVSSPVDVRAVAGQAVRIRVPEPIEKAAFHPVVSGNDIHVVPLGNGEYWVGATVEFPPEPSTPGCQHVTPENRLLTEVLQGAYDLCPALAGGTIVQQWVGQRPRPWNRAAPVLTPLDEHPHILLATGHYRNGVLLAPATAQWVISHIQ